MVLKQRFTNNTEQNTDIGNSYLLIQKHLNRQRFTECGEDLYGEKEWEVVKERDNIAAFVVHHQGEGKKTEALFTDNYNAIMSNNGVIYNVVTCMPD
jgi:hypothetical protein